MSLDEQSIFAISSLVVSLLVALKVFITDIHLKKCHTCCIDSDCSNGSISKNNSSSTL
jgi:hypothetical protein